MTTTPVQTYQGNCHCGRYRFNLTVPEIKRAVSCTCSLCKKKGSLWLVPLVDSFRVVRDDDRLTSYESASLQDKFCNFCGTQVVGEHLTGPLAGQFAVNVRTIREPYVNPFQLDPEIVTVEEDNRVLEPAIRDPSEPPARHVFACHCHQVQAELLSLINEEEIKEDNCSSCARIGYVGVYPTKYQVRIYGREHGFEYLAGRKFSGGVYCKTCGVHVFSNVYGPPISVFDKLPPERRENALKIYHKNMQLQPLNVRVMEGVELSCLEINRTDEGTEGYELED